MRTPHRFVPMAFLLRAGCASKTQTGAVVGAVVGGVAGTLIGTRMDKQASELKENIKGAKVERVGGSDLLILGHSDQLGSSAYNQALSERRANSAATYLTSQGVSGTRMATRGLSETEPIAPNETEAGRRANRRVENRDVGVSAGTPIAVTLSGPVTVPVK